MNDDVMTDEELMDLVASMSGSPPSSPGQQRQAKTPRSPPPVRAKMDAAAAAAATTAFEVAVAPSMMASSPRYSPPYQQRGRQRQPPEQSRNDSGDDGDDNNSGDDDEAERLRRLQEEEERSLELARALMAEEAMLSYQQHFEVSQDDLSPEQLEAYRAAMQEEEREQAQELGVDEEALESGDFGYDAMLQLGERIGDVKTERWALIARQQIEQLPTFVYSKKIVNGTEEASKERKTQSQSNHRNGSRSEGDVDVVDDAGEDSCCCDHKCLVCQCEYDDGDTLRRLPCGHCFDKECVDRWLLAKDCCPYCRQSIVDGDVADTATSTAAATTNSSV